MRFCMSSVWVRLLLRATHTAALVPHLRSPTLTTASCALPWTFISARLALPVRQENGGSADQTTPHTCGPECTVIRGNRHLFWQQFSYLSPPFCACSAVPSGGPPALTRQATWFPHISSLPLPLWPAVPTALGGVGGLWNFRSCRVWSMNFLSLSLSLSWLPPRPHPNSPPSESLRAIWEVSQLKHRAVCAPLTWSKPSQAPLQGRDPCSTAQWSLRGLAPQTLSMTPWCHTRACAYV